MGNKKKIYCEHCGSSKGPLVYKRELGAYYCAGHADPGALGAEPYTPVEKAWRRVSWRTTDGFIADVTDEDKPSLGAYVIPLEAFCTDWGGEVIADTMSWKTGRDPKYDE